MLYAHTPNDTGEWQRLDRHLAAVAERAGSFAEVFGAREHAVLVGLLHDLGKANPEFQDYLLNCQRARESGTHAPRTKVPHAIWGAAFLYSMCARMAHDGWKEFALPLQAHHTKLPDGELAERELLSFLQERPAALGLMQGALKEAIDALDSTAPEWTLQGPVSTGRGLRIRMIFSALVDADRLDSEEHSRSGSRTLRQQWPSMEAIQMRFLRSDEPAGQQSTTVKRVRDAVFEACRASAFEAPGFFRLTVPTGGGKTRSGLAFALQHAVAHEMRRVVFALPYTSIIDQTASVYRDMLGDDALLEHHSALDVQDEEGEDEQALRQRLATENWEAPIIVTTTVQLFESLFTGRPSKARKLHRLAKSVIVLDEIQAFPLELLRPTIAVLKVLTTSIEDGGYGATVVFSTATQPAFEVGPLAELLKDVKITEIVGDYETHYRAMQRVTYEWRPEPMEWSALAAELRKERQILAVLNTRKDALALVDALGEDEDLFHLSTLLCGAHRRAVLQRVRELLAQDRPVKLVSTQVVECGVDLDFPTVFRALGPLDRIGQAAGRCNRNARRDKGRVVIFEPAAGSEPQGSYKLGSEKARLLLKERDIDELRGTAIYRDYFQMLLVDGDAGGGLDKWKIQDAQRRLDFPSVDEDYRLIRQDTTPVVIQFGTEWEPRLDDWKHSPSRRAWQRLQPFIVNLFTRELDRYQGALEEVSEDLWLWTGDYDTSRHRGIGAAFADPSDLYIDPSRLVV